MISNSTAAHNETREKIASFGPKGQFLLWCIDQGWWIFPLRRVLWVDGKPHCTCPAGEACPTVGKHPAGKWGEPLDPGSPRTLRAILARLKIDQAAGWGVHLGLSNLEAFDVDTKGEGLANWRRLQVELGIGDCEPFTRSGSGGLHYLFRRSEGCDQRKGWQGPNGHTSCCVKFPGLGEWCSGQHYLAMPYSIHATGRSYELAGGPVYDRTPPELAGFVNGHYRFTEVSPATRPAPVSSWATTSTGGNSDLERAIAYLEAVPGAVAGQHGHDATYKVACVVIKDFALSMDDALTALRTWNDRCSPPWSDDDLIRKLQEADKSPGPRGRLRDEQRPYKGPEQEQWLRDLVCRIHWGRKILIGGANNSLAGVEYAPGWHPDEIDLTDLAAAAVVASTSDSLEPSPPAAADSPSPAAELQAVAVDPDDTWPEDPPRPAAQSCPHCTRIVMQSLEGTQGAVFFFPCRKLRCPFCGPIKREHWKATVRHHIAELVRRRGDSDTEPIYVFRCGAASWPRVAAYIRSKVGDFFRLDYTATAAGPGDSFMVVSTVKPFGADVRPYTPEAARDRLLEAIDGLPSDIRGKIFTSSHGWKLLADDTAADKKWKKVTRITTGELTAEEILRKHGRQFRYMRGSARWWKWNAIIFSIAGSDFAALVDDLDMGAKLSGVRVKWKKKQDPPPTDSPPPASSTDPPAKPPFTVELD